MMSLKGFIVFLTRERNGWGVAVVDMSGNGSGVLSCFANCILSCSPFTF